MENIWEIFEFMRFITDQPRNGALSPNEVSLALQAGQNVLFSHYYGDGKELNQVSTDALMPFGRSIPLTSNATGFITAPVDYGHIRSIKANGTQCRPVLHTELGFVNNSVLYPVSSFPRHMSSAGGFQLFPERPTHITLEYYASPAPPVIGYTMDDEDPEYDPTASTQLTFDRQYWIEVVLKTLPFLGVNLSNTDVFALSNQFEAKPATA